MNAYNKQSISISISIIISILVSKVCVKVTTSKARMHPKTLYVTTNCAQKCFKVYSSFGSLAIIYTSLSVLIICVKEKVLFPNPLNAY